MEQVDQSFESLKNIKESFKDFIDRNGYVTEADTRVNLIDKILINVLLWPEADIKREKSTSVGYLDYLLSINWKNLVCVEAKKEGTTFTFPADKKRKIYKISGSVSTDKNVNQAIVQARNYCDDSAIRYAIVTNGYTWIVFRAIRDDISWKEGNARVFYSIDEILDSFTEFWNLLSYECINQGSLDAEFSSATTNIREVHRVLNLLLQPDLPLLRNSLNTQLNPIINHFFEDIADPNYIETLENCYVYLNSVKTVANDISFAIVDAIPKFLKDEGTVDIKQGKNNSGIFGRVIENAVRYDRDTFFFF